ncbi:hypothetical protein SFUMM280S_01127 [Streptomyces fumanus]
MEKKYAMMPFSSRGPREDGGFTPTLTAPGAAINTIQTWLPGAPAAGAGYALPAGYGMHQGTSIASPGAAMVLAAAPEGRLVWGEVNLVNARGTVAGTGSVAIGKVVP